ncbi:MAG TPA: cation transporter [Candidatus Coprenecus merdipullorum]|nr:cation transporter [Candidatus Coprenecus merdipullorum]
MSKVVYKVKGMMCNHCVMHVQKALESLPGVKATVTLEPAEAVIEFSEKVYDRAGLQSVIIEKAGEYILEDK